MKAPCLLGFLSSKMLTHQYLSQVSVLNCWKVDMHLVAALGSQQGKHIIFRCNKGQLIVSYERFIRVPNYLRWPEYGEWVQCWPQRSTKRCPIQSRPWPRKGVLAIESATIDTGPNWWLRICPKNGQQHVANLGGNFALHRAKLWSRTPFANWEGSGDCSREAKRTRPGWSRRWRWCVWLPAISIWVASKGFCCNLQCRCSAWARLLTRWSTFGNRRGWSMSAAWCGWLDCEERDRRGAYPALLKLSIRWSRSQIFPFGPHQRGYHQCAPKRCCKNFNFMETTFDKSAHFILQSMRIIKLRFFHRIHSWQEGVHFSLPWATL